MFRPYLNSSCYNKSQDALESKKQTQTKMVFTLKKYALGLVIAGFVGSVSYAQTAAEIIEKARAEAGQFNEFKAALEDPDQSVRLAVFEAMLQQKNPPLRMMAIQYGLSSTDHVIRSRALAAQIMSMDQLHIQLEPNPNVSAEVQKVTAKELVQLANKYDITLKEKNPETGSFQCSSVCKGQVNNLQLVISDGNDVAISLALQEDNTLKGTYSKKTSNASPSAIAVLRLF